MGIEELLVESVEECFLATDVEATYRQHTMTPHSINGKNCDPLVFHE